MPGPGELCFPPDPALIKVRADRTELILAPDQSRDVIFTVDPDFCDIGELSFSVDDAAVAMVSVEAGRIDLDSPSVKITVTGVGAGTAMLTASFSGGDGDPATKSIPVDVLSADVPACEGSGSGRLDDGTTLSGSGGLALASIGLQEGATKPNEGSFLWGVDPFDATIACADDQVPDGFQKLGPAVTFGPEDLKFKRDIPFSVPINPAAMPELARKRHITVSYSGPRAATPRIVPIADPLVLKDGDGYKLAFKAPWLGTYQALVKSNAGTVKRTRRITHRAIIGVSMGGGGAAMAGFRNHEKFDVLAPLGGPVEWTWLLGHIQRNHVGGFHPNDGTNVPAGFPEFPAADLPYEHPSSFNRWWYEYPKTGNGGSFPRSEYVQIFRDLALMFGNPSSYNSTPGAENLPAGIAPDDPSVVGNRANRECAVFVDPISDHPDEQKQRDLNNTCPAERCSFTTRLENYYDAKYNPLGTWPVITFCDGTPQDSSLSPWANTWKDGDFNNKPMELALAVDFNDNGKRDENEPVISQPHEPFEDVGADGLASVDEPGYQAGVNEDPAGDDWHPQYNPWGTEGNYRYDDGEPYSDFGLDGVDGTVSSPYDFGEGNGSFDYTPGYKTFLARDSRTVISQNALGDHAEPFDDDAMARLDLWTDGGTRDLFNFAVSGQALVGEWAARDNIVHYYTQFELLPGLDPNDPSQFTPGKIFWEDIPSGVFMRYGKIDPNEQDIENGAGQHVGTPDELVKRLQGALYYIGSRWPDAPRTQDEAAAVNPDPDAEYCTTQGGCDFMFTDSRGRTGPVSVNFPPGYSHAESKNKRYPVIYMLHGYGQTPEDLKAAIVFLRNWMNSPSDASATRLPAALLVYVDGRCRPNEGEGEESECVRGTFFTDSVRDKGPKMESWWMELVDEIDSRYRTMGPTEIEWVE